MQQPRRERPTPPARASRAERSRSATRAYLVGANRGPAPRGAAATLAGLLERSCDAPGGALARLLAHDPEEGVRELAMMLLFCAAKDPQVPRRTRRAVLRTAVPELQRAFADPAVADERKLDIGPLLRMCGVVISPEEYVRAFRDYEGSRSRQRDEAVRRSRATPEEVTEHLLAAGVIDGDADDAGAIEGLLEVAEAAADHNPPLGAMMLGVLAAIANERGLESFPFARVIARAEATATGEAAWFLQVLDELPGGGGLGERAGAASRRLAEAGVIALAPEGRPFVQGSVTMVDGAGSRQLILTFEESPTSDLLFLLLNDQTGIKETYCRFGCDLQTLREIESALSQVAGAPCDIRLARSLVADALSVHERTGTAPGGTFVLYRHLLGIEPLIAAARAPCLGAYDLDALKLEPGLVQGSEELADELLCNSLYCASEEAYRFVERLQELHESTVAPGAAHLVEFAEVAIRDRETLLRRIAVNLELEALAGREGQETNRRLARLYQGLRHEVVPFGETPFVRSLCEKAIQTIGDNLARGYRSQLEVAAAALHPPDDLDPYQ